MSPPIPVDEKLYNKTKKRIYKKIPKHSAYRSGIVVKAYKKAFTKKHGNESPYIGKKGEMKGLKRCFHLRLFVYSSNLVASKNMS